MAESNKALSVMIVTVAGVGASAVQLPTPVISIVHIGPSDSKTANSLGNGGSTAHPCGASKPTVEP